MLSTDDQYRCWTSLVRHADEGGMWAGDCQAKRIAQVLGESLKVRARGHDLDVGRLYCFSSRPAFRVFWDKLTTLDEGRSPMLKDANATDPLAHQHRHQQDQEQQLQPILDTLNITLPAQVFGIELLPQCLIFTGR